MRYLNGALVLLTLWGGWLLTREAARGRQMKRTKARLVAKLGNFDFEDSGLRVVTVKSADPMSFRWRVLCGADIPALHYSGRMFGNGTLSGANSETLFAADFIAEGDTLSYEHFAMSTTRDPTTGRSIDNGYGGGGAQELPGPLAAFMRKYWDEFEIFVYDDRGLTPVDSSISIELLRIVIPDHLMPGDTTAMGPWLQPSGNRLGNGYVLMSLAIGDSQQVGRAIPTMRAPRFRPRPQR